MGNVNIEACKIAIKGVETLFKGKKSVPLYTSRKIEGVGEELTHLISGEKAFMPQQLKERTGFQFASETQLPSVTNCARTYTAEGKQTGCITAEEFNKMRNARLVQENAHTYRDTLTGNEYFKNSDMVIVGGLPRMTKPDGSFSSIPAALWSKIINLFK